MTFISDNYSNSISKLPEGVKLVAITKTVPAESVLEIYNKGQRLFGENKVQELTSKANVLPDDIQWHLVGHLQSNKVKYIAPFISMIESVDSLKLLSVINKEALKNNRVIDCLLQVHIAQEETKFGLSEEEVLELLSNAEYTVLKNVRICGLMGMATFTENMDIVRQEFRGLKVFFDAIKRRYFEGKDYFSELSMGMSDDYMVAIVEGATIIRIGSLIFGERIYS